MFFNSKTTKIDREVKHYAGAHIDEKTGALVTTLPEKLDIGSFPKGVYHIYDYSIWYRNLQENVANRCREYLKK